MKNDNIHIFFSLFWLQILNLPALLQNIHCLDRTAKSRPRKNQSERTDLRETGFAI